jgi:NitT/TauT family transport system permease protein
VTERGRLRRSFRSDGPAVKVAAAVVFIGGWEVAVAATGVRRYLLPPPSAIAERLVDNFPVLLGHTWVTAGEALGGLGLALIVGVAFAVTMAYSSAVRGVMMPAMAAFNAVPKVAFAPLLIVWLGLGYESKVATAFLLSLFPIMVNTTTGLRDVDAGLIDLARLMRASEVQQFVKIRLPNALPALFDALRIAAPLAVVGAIVAEFVAARAGLGFLIVLGGAQLNTELVFAAIVMIVVFSLTLHGLLAAVESRVLSWRESARYPAG